MNSIKYKTHRILTDGGGYALLLLALLTGWLPGPGGIPLALAGLGLLSIHNKWARRLRNWLMSGGTSVFRMIFSANPILQAAYDIVVSLLLIVAAVLAWRHHAIWELSLGITLFCIALAVGLANRNRYARLRTRFKRKR